MIESKKILLLTSIFFSLTILFSKVNALWGGTCSCSLGDDDYTDLARCVVNMFWPQPTTIKGWTCSIFKTGEDCCSAGQCGGTSPCCYHCTGTGWSSPTQGDFCDSSRHICENFGCPTDYGGSLNGKICEIISYCDDSSVTPHCRGLTANGQYGRWDESEKRCVTCYDEPSEGIRYRQGYIMADTTDKCYYINDWDDCYNNVWNRQFCTGTNTFDCSSLNPSECINSNCCILNPQNPMMCIKKSCQDITSCSECGCKDCADKYLTCESACGASDVCDERSPGDLPVCYSAGSTYFQDTCGQDCIAKDTNVCRSPGSVFYTCTGTNTETCNYAIQADCDADPCCWWGWSNGQQQCLTAPCNYYKLEPPYDKSSCRSCSGCSVNVIDGCTAPSECDSKNPGQICRTCGAYKSQTCQNDCSCPSCIYSCVSDSDCASGYVCCNGECHKNQPTLYQPIIDPSSPSSQHGFTIYCPTDSQWDCIDAFAHDDTYQCTWTGWSGFNAIFSCSGRSAGTYTAKCKTRSGTSNDCCSVSIEKTYTVIPSTSTTVPPPYSCSDTDGGMQPTIKGTVSGYKNYIQYSYTDVCVDSTYLKEYYCSGTTPVNSTYNCKNYGSSYMCYNGYCRYVGGGCPTLFVYDGKVIHERKTNIHSQKGIDTVDDIILSVKPAIVDGMYILSLKETTLPEHSYIDSVKLFVEGSETELLSAIHSRYGDVTETLAKSDDVRTDTKVFDNIELKFAVPKLNSETNSYIFEIEGYNPASEILGYWRNFPVKLDIADVSLIIAVIAVIILVIIFFGLKFFAKKK